MDVNLTSEERAQILSTIEMFEVITQTQPDDCQSLDILKEAYVKIGQQDDALRISRLLASAYLQNGLYSSALLECEGILSKQPDSPDVLALMGEIESRAGKSSGGSVANVQPQEGRLVAPENNAQPTGHSGQLVDMTKPQTAGGGRGAGQVRSSGPRAAHGGHAEAPAAPTVALPAEDGNEQFAKFLVHHRIAPERAAASAIANLRSKNARIKQASAPVAALLDEIARAGGPEVDVMMSGLIDQTKFGYVPLELYDIDRSVVRMLPESLTMGRLFVPFDVVSRTIMIAICNPFDGAAKEATHSSLDYHIQWYLAKPSAILKVLRDAYRLDARD